MASTPAPQSTSVQSASARPIKPVGTGYTNIQSLLNNSNATNLGNTIGQNVSKNVNQTVGNIQGAQNQFNQGTTQEQNRIGGLSTNAQNALSQVSNAPSTTTYSTDANGNPVQNLVSGQDVSNYNNYLNTGYQGPTDLNNVSNLQNQTSTSQGYANLLGSQPGQQQLLRTFVNNPNYSNTLQNLDSLYLGNNGIQKNLQGVRSNALQQLNNNNVNNLSANDQQQAQVNSGGLAQGQQTLNTNTQNVVSGINTAIGNQLTGLQNTTNAQNANWGQINSGNYGATDANGNPILDSATQSIANAYLKNNIAPLTGTNGYFNYTNANDLTTPGAANQTQAAQLAALAQLTNNSGLVLTPTAGGSIGDALASQLNLNSQGLQQNAQQRLTGAETATNISSLLGMVDPGYIPDTDAMFTNRGSLGSDSSGVITNNPVVGGNNYNSFTASQQQALNDAARQSLANTDLNKSGLNSTLNTTGLSTTDVGAIQQLLNQYYGLSSNATLGAGGNKSNPPGFIGGLTGSPASKQ